MCRSAGAALATLAFCACADQHASSTAVAPTPVLPGSTFAYSLAGRPLPRHFIFDPSGSAIREDNTPAGNPVTDAGATLGRVLFYDARLSSDRRVSCATCHQQAFGFADTARYSRGVGGAATRRHTMALANARFYASGRFFRDERATSLEEQTLAPIQDPHEMGLPLGKLTRALESAPYYAPLFQAAFGTREITAERVGRALAQFVRALVSDGARIDLVFRGGGPPNLAVLSPEELEGRHLFIGPAGCSRCHRTNALDLDHADNIGLDVANSDTGAGKGAFKTASLRNVAIRPPYMHDGRFATLIDVVDFYDHGVQDNPYLDRRLRGPDGAPQRLHLSAAQRQALVAYLRTFTDEAFLHDERFADPFPPH